jgi:hypothetical protein
MKFLAIVYELSAKSLDIGFYFKFQGSTRVNAHMRGRMPLRVSLALGDMQRKSKIEKIGRGRAVRWKLAS